MSPGPPASPRISLADYERDAERVLDPGAFGYYVGGAGDELTLRDNLAAWRRWAILPRVLTGVGERDPSVEVLGRRRPHPLVIAPMAFQRLAHPDGELATAVAAAQTSAVMCLSTLSTSGLDAVAESAPEATRWFQVYVFRDRGVTREMVSQAVKHGYEALVVTVDLPIMGVRERDLRSGVDAAASAVPSALAAGARNSLTPADFAGLIDPDLRWADIEKLVAESPLPVVVKGVLAPEDAVLAAEHGARGVVVSNHGGRQLDTVPAGVDALPAVVEAAGDRLDVLVDGGIRRGTDVLKALALGARAVMVGRPVLWGLAVDGPTGAATVLRILLGELDAALALTGSPRAGELSPAVVRRTAWEVPAR